MKSDGKQLWMGLYFFAAKCSKILGKSVRKAVKSGSKAGKVTEIDVISAYDELLF